MTREEKAQAYDEALERARKQKYDYQKEFNKTDKNSQLAEILRAGISAIELAFPELAESEDERIRKKLIWQVQMNVEDETADLQKSVYNGVKGHDSDLEESIEDWKKCLAWLEKQKEQKLVKIDEDIELGLDRALQIIKEAKGVLEGYQSDDGIYECDHAIRTLTHILKNGIEQKPLSTEETELNSIAFLEQMGYTCIPPGAKTAEWSEEDERILNGIIGLIDHDQHYGVSNKEMLAWLKSLRPAKDCSSCAKHLEGYISGRSDAENKLLVQFGALVTPEDELHIKPRWKPGEEQMQYLLAVINDPNNAGAESCHLILESLYNDLKKL